jgi:FkbM family methyltransferase
VGSHSSLRRNFRLVKRWLKSAVGLDVFVRPGCSLPLEQLGSGPGAWVLCPCGLNETSVVYSFGVGRDISFERALIEKYAVTVHAFDPTPLALAWIRTQDLPDRFTLHEFGLAAYDGTACFQAPSKAKFESFSLVRSSGVGDPVIAPVQRFATVSALLKHRHVSVLKLDIEGAEYEVLDDVLASGIQIDQILVEFHHRWKEVEARQTRRAIANLRSAGWCVAHVSDTGMEYTFVAQGSITSRT